MSSAGASSRRSPHAAARRSEPTREQQPFNCKDRIASYIASSHMGGDELGVQMDCAEAGPRIKRWRTDKTGHAPGRHAPDDAAASSTRCGARSTAPAGRTCKRLHERHARASATRSTCSTSRTTRTRRRSSARRARCPTRTTTSSTRSTCSPRKGQGQLGDDEPADAEGARQEGQAAVSGPLGGLRPRSSPVRAAASDARSRCGSPKPAPRSRCGPATRPRCAWSRREIAAARGKARAIVVDVTDPDAVNQRARPRARDDAAGAHDREQRGRRAAQVDRGDHRRRMAPRDGRQPRRHVLRDARVHRRPRAQRGSRHQHRVDRGTRRHAAARRVLRGKAWRHRAHAGACRGAARC